MRKLKVLPFLCMFFFIACGGEDTVNSTYYASKGTCHENRKGKGHDDHKGFGWGHHKCEKKCYKKQKVCKEVKFCNPAYNPYKCKKCKALFEGCNEWRQLRCEKNFCRKYITRTKCWWKKVNVECPPRCKDDNDCPPKCEGSDCPCEGDDCPPPPPVCGDETCDPNETCESCQSDCGECPPPPPSCGDEQCNGDETCKTCAEDCGNCPPPPPVCGDNTCDPTESCSTCQSDCGECPPPPPVCGDGTCDPNENCRTCSSDCGECPPPLTCCGDGVCSKLENCSTCPSDCGECQEPDAGVEPDYGVPYGGSTVTGPSIDAGVPEDDIELVGGGGCNVGHTDVGFGAMLILGVAVFMIRKKFIGILAAFILIGISAPVQAAPPVGNFKTAPTVGDYWTTQRTQTLGHLDFNAQALFNYSHKPLRLISKSTGETVGTVLRFRHNLDVALTVGLKDKFELGLVVPMSLGQGASNLGPLGYSGSSNNFERADFGDLRLVPKVHLATDGQMSLGLALPVTLPTGDRMRLLGENGATVAPTLLVGVDTKHISVGANVGFQFRSDQSHAFRNQEIKHSDELTYSLGVRVPLVRDYGMLHKLDLIGDLWGALGLDQQDKEELPMEFMGGLRAHMDQGVVLNLAAGAGLTKGYGVPEWRVLWGFSWEFDHQEVVCKPCKNKVTKVTKIVGKTRIEHRTLVLPSVYFDTDKYNLRPDAVNTLNEVVYLLVHHPWVTKVRLEGHTDHRASNKYNNVLAKQRVTAVLEYLLKNGIKLDRLKPRSYGETQRVDTTKIEPGMQLNRRVEFHVLEVTK